MNGTPGLTGGELGADGALGLLNNEKEASALEDKRRQRKWRQRSEAQCQDVHIGGIGWRVEHRARRALDVLRRMHLGLERREGVRRSLSGQVGRTQ